jgi:hypothetical protein
MQNETLAYLAIRVASLLLLHASPIPQSQEITFFCEDQKPSGNAHANH